MLRRDATLATAPKWARHRALVCLAILALLSLPIALSSQEQDSGKAQGADKLSREAAESAANKFQHIYNGSTPGHSFGSIRISETELNSYIDYDVSPELPPGISKIRLKLEPGRPRGTADVDFDKLKEGLPTQPNPLVALFLRGAHTLGVEGTLSSANGMAEFHIESVTLDDWTVPQSVVDYLIYHYLIPRYPAATIDRPFPLAFSIDQLTVESGSVLVTGRPMSATSNGKRLHSGLSFPRFH